MIPLQKIDQFRMLSRLSLDLAAICTVGKHAVLHVSKVVSIYDCRQDLLGGITHHQRSSLNARCPFFSCRVLGHLLLNDRNRVLECVHDSHQISLDFAEVLRRVSGRSPLLCVLLALLFCLLAMHLCLLMAGLFSCLQLALLFPFFLTKCSRSSMFSL